MKIADVPYEGSYAPLSVRRKIDNYTYENSYALLGDGGYINPDNLADLLRYLAEKAENIDSKTIITDIEIYTTDRADIVASFQTQDRIE